MNTVKLPQKNTTRHSKYFGYVGIGLVVSLICYTGYFNIQVARPESHSYGYREKFTTMPTLNKEDPSPEKCIVLIYNYGVKLGTLIRNGNLMANKVFKVEGIYTAREFGNRIYDKYFSQISELPFSKLIQAPLIMRNKSYFSSAFEKAWDKIIKYRKSGHNFDRSFYQFYIFTINSYLRRRDFFYNTSKRPYELLFYRFEAIINNLQTVVTTGESEFFAYGWFQKVGPGRPLTENLMIAIWYQYFYSAFNRFIYDDRPMSEWYKN